MEVLIIEDEPLAAEKLIKLLFEYDKSIEVIATLRTVEESVYWLKNNIHPGLLLLDIQLADGLCFDIFKEVQVKCPVIFCTAYDQYALKAFQLHSIDYLLKPVQYAKLANAIEKMREMLPGQAGEKLPSQLDEIISIISNKAISYKSRFMVKLGNKIKTIRINEIAYFHSNNKLTMLVTKDGFNYPVDYSLDDLIALLDPQLFFHISRKLIIHIESAKEIHPYFKGRLKLILIPHLDEEIIVSSQKTPQFKAWLDT